MGHVLPKPRRLRPWRVYSYLATRWVYRNDFEKVRKIRSWSIQIIQAQQTNDRYLIPLRKPSLFFLSFCSHFPVSLPSLVFPLLCTRQLARLGCASCGVSTLGIPIVFFLVFLRPCAERSTLARTGPYSPLAALPPFPCPLRGPSCLCPHLLSHRLSHCLPCQYHRRS